MPIDQLKIKHENSSHLYLDIYNPFIYTQLLLLPEIDIEY